MKKIITLLFVCIGLSTFAQTPESFKYQAVVRDVSGTLLNNQAVGLRISIIENSVSGPSVYTETFNLSTNDYGLANISIGTGNVQSGVFSTIDWGNSTHYIQVELDATGGSNYQLVGTSQLLSVPYALYAKNVENDQVDDADSDPTNENQTLSISGSDITISNGNTVTIPGTGSSALNDLTDVNATTPQTNDILMWNGTNWVAGDICSLFGFYYLDSDNDGFGDSETAIYTCSAPNGYVSDSTDCYDNNATINPNATEICDNIDNNCDGQIDEGLNTNTYYYDNDGDGYGDPNNSILSCAQQPGYELDGTDCDDNDADINPGQPEVCNGTDNDCDGSPDNGLAFNTYYYDGDSDGYGDGNNSITSCTQPSNYVADGTDCDDSDSNINPGQPEVCDGADNDCDGSADNGLTFNTYYYDGDSDGYGDGNNSITSCIQPSNYIADGTDCDDNDASIHPDATEIAGNGIDEDCDGMDACPSPGTPCDDGLFCTTNDEYDGSCNCAGTPTNCDDGDPNTSDFCNEAGATCDHVCNVGSTCDDGDACTVNDIVDSGCNCIGDALDCDDGDPNTIDSCDPVLGCIHECLPPGNICDDGSPCTINDVMDSNCNCIGTPVNCDDGDPNTTDACNETNGQCEHTP